MLSQLTLTKKSNIQRGRQKTDRDLFYRFYFYVFYFNTFFCVKYLVFTELRIKSFKIVINISYTYVQQCRNTLLQNEKTEIAIEIL